MQQWINANMELPKKDGCYLIAYLYNQEDYEQEVVRFEIKDNKFYPLDNDYWDYPIPDVTHWMELPPNPA